MSLIQDEQDLTYAEQVAAGCIERISQDESALSLARDEIYQLKNKIKKQTHCPRCGHDKHGDAVCAQTVGKSDDSYSYWSEQCGCSYKEMAA